MTTHTRKTVLVTGGAGFIGSHTVDLLVAQGYKLRVIDNLLGGREANLSQQRSNADVVVDYRDVRNIAPADTIYRDVAYIIHFAGIGDIVPSIDNPIEYLSTNVIGTVHVLEGARHAGVRKFVYAASSSCYGLADVPTPEDAPIKPEYPYALSKYQGEQATFHWQQVYRLPVVSLRIFNAYGPRVRTSGAYGAVFGVFLKQKLAGKPFTVVGDGQQLRDFVYVTDVARAFIMAAESPLNAQVFNLGAGNPQSINRLVELLGGGARVHLPKRPAEPHSTFADISKITQELGWKTEVTFEQGVAIMLENIAHWQDAPLWDAEAITHATRGWFQALGSQT